MPIINTKKMQTPTYRSLFQHLREGRLEVPDIQRQYAWESEQIEDFYSDISQMLQSPNIDDIDNNEINIAIGQGIFYFNDETMYIYDGQQRIITYILFCKALANKMLELYNVNNNPNLKKKIETLSKAYLLVIKNEDGEFTEESRLTVQQKDRDSLDFVLGLSKTRKKSNSFIDPAFKLISSWIKKIDTEEDLLKLFDILTSKIEMLILIARNDSDAEGLFYSTNSTGKPLSISQLLHARVHQLFKSNKGTISKWDSIYNKINDKVKRPEILDSYLLYSVQVDEFVITTAKVFTHINKILNQPNGKAYLEKIISRLEILYGLIYDNNESFRAINTLVAITAIKQVYPLFIALSEIPGITDKKVAEKTLDILTYIVLQNNVIRQSPGTTKHSLAIILKNIKDNKGDIFDQIEKEQNTLNKLVDPSISFDNKTGKALFVLCALYNDKSDSSLIISNKGTEIEHIVPQDYSKWTKEHIEWREHIDKFGDNIIYSLGNFLLLSKKINQNISNKIWESKDGAKGKKDEILTISFLSIFSSIFDDKLRDQVSITPEYVVDRGKKIAKIFVDGIFSKFII